MQGTYRVVDLLCCPWPGAAWVADHCRGHIQPAAEGLIGQRRRPRRQLLHRHRRRGSQQRKQSASPVPRTLLSDMAYRDSGAVGLSHRPAGYGRRSHGVLRWQHVDAPAQAMRLARCECLKTARSQLWPLCCCSCSLQFLMARCTAASALARVAVSHRIFDACHSDAAMCRPLCVLHQAGTCAVLIGWRWRAPQVARGQSPPRRSALRPPGTCAGLQTSDTCCAAGCQDQLGTVESHFACSVAWRSSCWANDFSMASY